MGRAWDNPFLRYRTRLDSYDAVRRGALGDDRFCELVGTLDEAVAAVDGRGFRMTPVLDGWPLAGVADLDHLQVRVKVEAANVGGSHKARHLFGVALHHLVAEALGAPPVTRLAIASCGNAAVGAAIVARALDRRLEVFVPDWADDAVVHRLRELGAAVHRCPRRPDEVGDPSVLRFREAVADGATPFSVQATETPHALDGGRTLGWEFAEQVDLDVVYLQVGGGAMAASTSMGLGGVRLHPVQAEGCAPFARAWERLGAGDRPGVDVMVDARDDPDRYMTAWSDPRSAATGILDDVVYDWLPLLGRTVTTGGAPVVAAEADIVRASKLVQALDLPISATGTAGLAGLLAEPPSAPVTVGLVLSGRDFGAPAAPARGGMRS